MTSSITAPQAGFSVIQTHCDMAAQPLLGLDEPPRLGWQITSEQRGFRQSAYQIQVAGSPELLTAGTPDRWDSGKVVSNESVAVAYAGAPLASRQACFWRVRVWDQDERASEFSAIDSWEMGLLRPADWTAQWIGRADCLGDWRKPVLPAPLFRNAIAIPGTVHQARAYICGLGYYELYVNGEKVGDHVLDPVVTHYDRRAGYVTYDITEHLVEGANGIGAILGNGWYNCSTADVWHFDKAHWRDYPKLLLQIEITLADGQLITLNSDRTWKVGESPIRFDALRNGEFYDARCEQPGWSTAGFDDSQWADAEIVPGPGGTLFSQRSPACKVMQTMDAVSVREVRPGVSVFDFGQNLAGWAQLRASAPGGTEIILKYAEKLTEDGDIDQSNVEAFILSGEPQTDRYTFKGQGEETWEPRFTFHGFRYAQVTGMPTPPARDMLRARVVHTAFGSAGEFSCSNELLNRIQRCTRWSYIGNFVGLPTDCPHREKNGWTGDAQLAAETGLLNYDSAAAYLHWLQTLADTQRPNGQLASIAPSAGWGYNWGSGPAWDSALILIPWYIYLYTGERRPLEVHYDSMRRYLAYCETLMTDGIIHFGLGDWCHVSGGSIAPEALTSTAYHYANCRIVADIAKLLGRTDDAELHRGNAEATRLALRRHFHRGNGIYAGGEQTSQACALHQGIVDSDEIPAVVDGLLAAIDSREGHIDAGILGAKYIPRALSENGEAARAYALLTRTDYPSWGDWIGQGATTLWETWRGDSSLNHIMFGDISAWMFSYLAGIRPHPQAPGFQRVVIHPNPVGDLTWVKAEHQGPYGPIRCHWHKTSDLFSLQVDIPANTTADVYLPAASAETVTESDRPLDEAKELEVISVSPQFLVRASSGMYRFAVRL